MSTIKRLLVMPLFITLKYEANAFTGSRPHISSVSLLYNRLQFYNFTSGIDVSECLNKLKGENAIRKWDITLLEPGRVSKTDLYLTTRTAFSTSDYMGDIIKAAKGKSYDFSILGAVISSFILSAVAVPQLPIPVNLKNILGLSLLFGPFLILGLIIVFPDLKGQLFNFIPKKDKGYQEDRILYHEAGHFLAGYLCGLPILGYDINGEKDAATTIDFSTLQQKPALIESKATKVNDPLQGRTGHLLVVSMAGVVAETLRFGNSLGGLEDFPIAYEVLRISRIPYRDQEDTLRWAILKALNLLRIYRDELDAVADAMRSRSPLPDCYVAIESTNIENEVITKV